MPALRASSAEMQSSSTVLSQSSSILLQISTVRTCVGMHWIDPALHCLVPLGRPQLGRSCTRRRCRRRRRRRSCRRSRCPCRRRPRSWGPWPSAAHRLGAVGAARVAALGPALAVTGEALGPVALEAVVDPTVAVVVDVVAQLGAGQHRAGAGLPDALGVAGALAFLTDATTDGALGPGDAVSEEVARLLDCGVALASVRLVACLRALASSLSTSLMPCFWQPRPNPPTNAMVIKLRVNANFGVRGERADMILTVQRLDPSRPGPRAT